MGVQPLINRYYLQELLAVMVIRKKDMLEVHDRVWHKDDVKEMLKSNGDIYGRRIR